MTNILYHNYYYRYKEQRRLLKPLIEANNFVAAKAILDSMIQEHATKYPLQVMMQRLDFNLGEHLTLAHAKRHIDEYILHGDSPYQDSDGSIRTQKDNIISILEFTPQKDYSSIL